MKALTIKQPWASLICMPSVENLTLGIKDIENRTWRTKFRGRIYVHASATYDPRHRNMSHLFTPEQYGIIEQNKMTLEMCAGSWVKSAIIGEVDIIDCVINHPSVWAEKQTIIAPNESDPDGFEGIPIYNWVLANPVLYDKPILNVKGKLSFWEYGK